ncbi:MAG: MFS transporter [Chloroflexota bacterium]
MPSAVQKESIRQTSTMAALKSPSFRLYFAGQLVSVSGTWMQAIAQQVVIYDLTKSELALGLVACAQGIPALLLTPFAGIVVERFPRRQILVGTQSAMMLLAFIFAALQFTHTTQIWHIVLLSLGIGAANALDAPARQVFVVEMVGRENLTSGIVLNSIVFNSARIVGPALGGLTLKAFGPAWCFFLNGLSFVAVIISLIVMTVPRVAVPPGRMGFLKPMLEGVQFARTHPAIRPLLLLSLMGSVFGLTFAVLIPSYADLVLHDTSGGTAALSTAQGLGAVLAVVAVARISNGSKGGKALTLFAFFGFLFMLLFALSNGYLLPAVFAAATGFCLIGQFTLTNTLLQMQVPDVFRGRVLSLYTLTFFGFSPFGGLAIGAVAQRIGTVQAIAVWGIIGLLLTAVIMVYNRQLWGLR